MSEKHHIIPVWFFVGLLLLLYGILIMASGITEWSHPPNTVLAEKHAAVWWGLLLTVLGSIYCFKFYPRRGST